MFGVFALLMTCLTWGLLLKPGARARTKLSHTSNVIHKICQELDSPNQEDMTSLDVVCFNCLIEKQAHSEHCQACNKCVRHFHLHCNFFNKCFGDANIRPYLLFKFLTLFQCLFYIYLIGRAYWAENASDFFFGKVMLTHSMMDAKVLVTFLMIEVYTVHVFDQCLTAFNALGLSMTINEYLNVHDYRYLFSVDSVRKSFDEHFYKLVHQPVPLWRFLSNPVFFFCGCRRKPQSQKLAVSYLLLRERQNTS